MRPRNSFVGPLLLIVIGVLFLMRSVIPNFNMAEVFRLYWPYLLIAWGILALAEVCIRFAAGRAVPVNGVGGGSWFFVVVLSIFGLTAFEIHRQNGWWENVGWEHGFSMLGEEHEFSIVPQQKTVTGTPHIVIERFRGDAKITGGDGDELLVSGHKEIRSMADADASKANSQTPVDVTVQGQTIVIRCNQDRADSRTPVTTYLDITIPKGASVEATGTRGDFDISGLSGDVDISSENAGVRLQDLGGSVKVDTRASDIVRCVNVTGNVDLRGHGDDVELTKVAGQVTISGDYTGTVTLHDLAKPVRVQDMRTQLEIQQIPGEVRLERGSVDLQNIVGPVKLETHDTDVQLEGVSNDVSMTIDKGDVEIRPARVPLGKMDIRTRSGNIEVALPDNAHFALKANTDHGEIDNEYGDGLTQEMQGRGARLQGTVGSGPDVVLNTGRGSITVRKTTIEPPAPTKAA